MLYNPEWKEHLDLSTPSLKALSYLLRHRELWPKGFRWNYGNCKTCAIGLADELWGFKLREALLGDHNDRILVINKSLEEKLGIEELDARHIFWGSDVSISRIDKVTPENVADMIDEYLLEKQVLEPVLKAV